MTKFNPRWKLCSWGFPKFGITHGQTSPRIRIAQTPWMYCYLECFNVVCLQFEVWWYSFEEHFICSKIRCYEGFSNRIIKYLTIFVRGVYVVTSWQIWKWATIHLILPIQYFLGWTNIKPDKTNTSLNIYLLNVLDLNWNIFTHVIRHAT